MTTSSYINDLQSITQQACRSHENRTNASWDKTFPLTCMANGWGDCDWLTGVNLLINPQAQTEIRFAFSVNPAEMTVTALPVLTNIHLDQTSSDLPFAAASQHADMKIKRKKPIWKLKLDSKLLAVIILLEILCLLCVLKELLTVKLFTLQLINVIDSCY